MTTAALNHSPHQHFYFCVANQGQGNWIAFLVAGPVVLHLGISAAFSFEYFIKDPCIDEFPTNYVMLHWENMWNGEGPLDIFKWSTFCWSAPWNLTKMHQCNKMWNVSATCLLFHMLVSYISLI